ncbi:MAG: hypothetical protein JO168_04170 [Solirubrobacterales bacterium]|nr:hypothetical protein [Solirubrobacterales bacterium]
MAAAARRLPAAEAAPAPTVLEARATTVPGWVPDLDLCWLAVRQPCRFTGGTVALPVVAARAIMLLPGIVVPDPPPRAADTTVGLAGRAGRLAPWPTA